MTTLPAPLLMSADNPVGWRLEDLLAQVRLELQAKADRIQDDKREIARRVYANNLEMVSLLSNAELLQRASIASLDAYAPNPGPLGKPRIGVGSDNPERGA